MKFFAAVLCVAAGVLLPATTMAADDITAKDIRCFIIAAQQAGSDDPETRSQGINATLYWLGRLDGRSPGMDLQKAIRTQFDAMTDSLMQSEDKRCRAIMGQRGKALIALSKALEGD